MLKNNFKLDITIKWLQPCVLWTRTMFKKVKKYALYLEISWNISYGYLELFDYTWNAGFETNLWSNEIIVSWAKAPALYVTMSQEEVVDLAVIAYTVFSLNCFFIDGY